MGVDGLPRKVFCIIRRLRAARESPILPVPPGSKILKEGMVKISQLFVYPVKSCAGIEIREMELGATGPLYDRMFVVVNDAGEPRTQREHPRLCLVRTLITRGHLLMRIPGGGMYATPLELGGTADRDVTIWGDACRGMDEGNAAATLFSDFLGEQCRLVRYLPEYPRLHESSSLKQAVSVSFSDGYPLLVIAQGSLDDLNRRLDEPVPMDRFRPNVVIGDAPPYAEDDVSWLTVNGVVLGAANKCKRCATTVVDQRTGMTSNEPLRTLATYRRSPDGKVVFGRNFRHLSIGMLHVGDPVIAT